MTVLEGPTTVTVAVLTGQDVQTFGRIISNIGKATVGDPFFRQLTGVQISATDGLMSFQATDQYRAVTVSFTPTESLVGFSPIIAEGKQLMKAGKMIGRKTESVTVTLDKADLRIETAEGLVIVPTFTEQWPKVDAIYEQARGQRYPTADEDKACDVNGLLLADLLTIMSKILGGRDPRISLMSTGVKDDSVSRGPWRWIGSEGSLIVESVMMGLRK